MYKSIKLKNVVEYSNERVNINQISIDNYVSTDNLLANKQGVTKALGLPPKSDKLPAFNAENILVANIRPYLKKIWFANKDGACSPDVLTFKVKDGFLPEFVYYALFRDDFFDHVMKGSKGTKMPRGDKNQILDFTIPFLTLDNQENITALLSILDAKIAINQKINKELESIIQDLYDFWFLQFDFPDQHGKPYKSSGGEMIYNSDLNREIPVLWKAGTLNDLGQIVGGSTPSTKNINNFSIDGTPWITPNDLSDNLGNKFIGRGAQNVSDLGIKSASLKIYPKGTVLLSSRAPIGYMAIAQQELTTNQGFKSFIPNKEFTTEFIYNTVKSSLDIIVKNATGSTFKEISGSVLKTVKICLPNFEAIESYTQLVGPYFKRQATLEQESQQITQLRDWLLPMLMNGQIEVH